jgi:hypothetical protein
LDDVGEPDRIRPLYEESKRGVDLGVVGVIGDDPVSK